ncbi:MAG: DNA polymerase III subunit beta [Microgenomates group bacterium]
MKLSVLQENLAKGLSTVSRSVASKAQLPVLGNILLATEKRRLKLSATNLETGINYWLGAKIEKEGAICVPAKILSEFVSFLPPEKIELEVKDNSLNLSCSSHSASFVGLPASEFPPVPTLEDKQTFSFLGEGLLSSISQVVFAAAQDEGRPVLTGVLFQMIQDNLVLVATDGYRLSFKKMGKIKEVEEVKEFKKGLIIPARTLAEVGKILSEQKQEEQIGLAITPSSNQIIFSTPFCEVVSRLIEGSFPEFEKIIPEKWTTKIVLGKEEFLRAVRMASIFARESANIIKFKIENLKLKISSNAPQVGENLVELEVKQEGDDNNIAFNSRYLLDFLNSVDTEQISFEMTTPLNPGVFRPVGDSSYLHIIMPVRVQE